jgi:hypothetical protein
MIVGATFWNRPALAAARTQIGTEVNDGYLDDPGLQMKPDPKELLVEEERRDARRDDPKSPLSHNISRSHYLTAVVMSYPKSSRFHLLEQIIRKVDQWEFVWEIILVWNGPLNVLPETIQRFFKDSPRKPTSGEEAAFSQLHKSRVQNRRPYFTILPQSINRVDNRWRIAEHVDTDAILNMDDDINLHITGAQCMLQVWRSSPSALVAIDVRSHFVHAKEGGGPHGPFGYVARDRSAGFKQYSIALPRALLTNREYYLAYDAAFSHKNEPPNKKGVKEIVDELLCDDIAFNFIAAKTRLPSNEQLSGGHVVYVKAKYAAYAESHSADGMTKKEGMKTMRQKCVNELAKHVGVDDSKQRHGLPADGMLLLHRPWHVLCDVDG